MGDVDVLIPTFERPDALALTLGSLVGQTHACFRVFVADQSERYDVQDVPVVSAAIRVLALRGHPVTVLKNLPRRGLAHQRHVLLEHVEAPYALYVDDDVVLEPDLVERLVTAIETAGCGFVGSFVNAPSAVDSDKPEDHPPEDLAVEFWDGPVTPEVVSPGSEPWERRHLHFAAHQERLARRLGLTRSDTRLYKVAWVGGCVLYDVDALRSAGGFDFWQDLPERHVGEDVLAQLRVMARRGGAAIMPSGAWHQEVPTTTVDRNVDAPLVLPAVAE